MAISALGFDDLVIIGLFLLQFLPYIIAILLGYYLYRIYVHPFYIEFILPIYQEINKLYDIIVKPIVDEIKAAAKAAGKAIEEVVIDEISTILNSGIFKLVKNFANQLIAALKSIAKVIGPVFDTIDSTIKSIENLIPGDVC